MVNIPIQTDSYIFAVTAITQHDPRSQALGLPVFRHTICRHAMSTAERSSWKRLQLLVTEKANKLKLLTLYG